MDRQVKYGTIDDKTYQVATRFKLDKGDINVMNHTDHVGLYGQCKGLWPHREYVKEIAIIFEDDITVSPFFYRYLKVVHAKYDSSPILTVLLYIAAQYTKEVQDHYMHQMITLYLYILF